jgi:hypothetical protein
MIQERVPSSIRVDPCMHAYDSATGFE